MSNASDDDPAAPALRIVVDDRELPSGLAEALADRWPGVAVGRLPVGDVEVGPRVLVERKTVADFVRSLEDGRLFRQAWALAAAGRRPLLIVEGEDAIDFGRLDPRALRGALIALAVDARVPLVRTASVEDTADWIAHLARREARRLAADAAADRDPPAPTAARVAMDLLAAIPGVGDLRARRLVERFGTVRAVASADAESLADVPGVGTRTAASVRRALGSRDEGVSEHVGDGDAAGSVSTGTDHLRERPPSWGNTWGRARRGTRSGEFALPPRGRREILAVP